MSVKIFARAEARLIEIWEYTAEQWGEGQADDYVRDLIHAINALQAARHGWRSVADKSLHGLWFIHQQHHYVFFRELPSGVIGVVSILHENMDLPARLKEDVWQGGTALTRRA